MRFRLGMAMGFCAGYVMGAKAGRVRYDQMKRAYGRFWESENGKKVRDEVQKMMEQGRTQVSEMARTMRERRIIRLNGEELNERVAPFVQGAHVEEGGTLTTGSRPAKKPAGAK